MLVSLKPCVNPEAILKGLFNTGARTLGGDIQVRFKFKEIVVPKPGWPLYLRRTVHYPEKYTIKPIPTTNLAGRDPETGRVVVATLGGGLKHPYLWTDYKRVVPPNSPPLIEKVIEIIPEPNRSAHVALVGHGDKLRYIIATENMKKGDIIKTSSELTRIAVRPNEGDAYPLGSLPLGTVICCLEYRPGAGGYFARGAGTFCTILRKAGQSIVVQIPTKREIALEPTCVAVVGRVSNAIHSSIPIGSPNNLRHLGYRPRSGLWHRKTGKHGRKIKPTPPLRDFSIRRPVKLPAYKLTMDNFPFHLP